MNLHNLQDVFQQYLMQGEQAAIKPMIADDKGFSADRRLRVYFDAYRIRLNEILKLDFPKTYYLMGDEHFDEAFFKYLNKHPSQHFSVRYFGQHFVDFLRSEAPYRDFPPLAEMAEFEWTVSYTIDAVDAPVVNVAAFQAVAPENWPDLTFTLHPSVKRCDFDYNTPQLWQLIESEESINPPEKQATPVCWLFWRKGIKSYFRSCTPPQAAMFEGVLNSLCFGDLCENLLPHMSEETIPGFVAQTLYQWVQDEMITSITLNVE